MHLNLAGRQWPLYIFERWGFEEWNAATNDIDGVMVVPAGAYVTQAIEAIVDTAFVGPTTAELIVENDVTGAAIATVDLTAAATTALLAAAFYPSGFKLRVAVNKSGAVATAGVARITGAYVIDKRATETQPGD